MKKIKYSCPFKGKYYPLYIILATSYLCLITGIVSKMPVSAVLLGIVLIAAVVLLICFRVEQHLSDKELELIAESEMPLWESAPADLQQAVRQYARPYSIKMFLVFACIIMVVLPVSIAFQGQSGILLITLSVMALVTVIDYLRRKSWRQIDESARYITVPIHHIYRLTRKGTQGPFMTETFFVFYLPDGRYIVKARPNCTEADAVTIVQFRGMFLWMPYFN